MSDKDLTPPSQTVLVNSASDTVLPYQTVVGYVSSESGWLSAVASASTAPSKVVVSVDAGGLDQGFYMGYVKLFAGGVAYPVTVTLKVGPQASTLVNIPLGDTTTLPAVNTVNVDPLQIDFQTTWRGAASKTVAITGNSTEKVYLNISGGGWLNYPSNDLNVPSNFTLTADSSLLSSQPSTPLTATLRVVGTDSGTLYATIRATLTIVSGSAGGLTATPSSLQFSQTAGGPVPGTKTITLTSSDATSFTVTSSANWLTVTPTSGTTSGSTTTPTILTVTANGTTLTPNPGIPYSATITISSAQQNLTIIVELSVTSGVTPALTATPAALSFNQTIGGAVPDAKTVTLSSTVATIFTATTTASWLSLNLPSTAGTSNIMTVNANAAGLSAGIFQSSILVTAGATTITIPVTFSVNTVAPSITVTPPVLALTQILGGPLPGGKIVVDSKDPTTFTATSDAAWLTVTPGTMLITPNEINVFVNRVLFAVGTYQANITVNGGTAPVTIPVTLTISGAAVTASPSSLSFSQAPGASAPPSQAVRIDSNAASNFTATANANWLTVSPTSGAAPGNINVSVNGGALTVGTYQSTITISTATTNFDIPVTLSVATPVVALTALPAAVEFTAAAGASGASAPQPKTVGITISGSTAASFIASAAVSGAGNWLTVSPTSGTTPSQLTVAVNINGLVAGQYQGAITVTPTDRTITTLVINVALTITSNTPGTSGVTVKAIVNAASLQPGPLAPGEIITIFGTGLGTTAGAGANISQAGAVGTSIGDTRVYFEGIQAPLTYARADQINAIVPYGIYGRFASSMQVEVAGNRSDALQLRIDSAAPGIFTVSGTGTGQAAVINQDGTVNSPIYPAPRGSIVAIYGTGEGQTRPAGQDGRIITTDLRVPVGTVTAKLAGAPVDVTYAGSAPGMVSGAFQINVMIPPAIAAGGQIPLEVSIAGVISQVGVTIAVK